MTIVGQVEIDEYCRRVLTKHWPDIPRYNDVRTCVAWWRSEPRPRVDLVAGGFCCQPHSDAGLKLGPSDERWLWPEFAAVVEAIRPVWVVWENVPGLRTRGLDIVHRDLVSLGYHHRVGWASACAVGSPHMRKRLLGVAHTAGQGRVPWRSIRRGPGAARFEQQDRFEPAGSSWWTNEPAVARVAYGVPGRMDRARALGNALIPAISAHVGRLILNAHNAQSK